MSCVTAQNENLDNEGLHFHTPTNQASDTLHVMAHANHDSKHERDTKALFAANDMLPIWLPVSTGDIKKTAQTRFVNSSPKSYRLMPASVESSEADRTSFVEKSSHKFLLPVSYFLEVAKLWAISNRSELECQFTQAKTEGPTKLGTLKNNDLEKDARRPICHTKAGTDSATACPWAASETTNQMSDCATTAEEDLLRSITRFLETCRKKDKSMAGGSDLSELSSHVGSETRRYLSQVISLMSKRFAFKLMKQQNGLSRAIEKEENRKRTVCDKLKNCQVVKDSDTETRHVNVFAMSASDHEESDNDQLFIIHIPTSQKSGKKEENENQTTYAGEPSKKRTRKCSNDSSNSESSMEISRNLITGKRIGDADSCKYNCFYCPDVFVDRPSCARHMLSHLTSGIDSGSENDASHSKTTKWDNA